VAAGDRGNPPPPLPAEGEGLANVGEEVEVPAALTGLEVEGALDGDDQLALDVVVEGCPISFGRSIVAAPRRIGRKLPRAHR
jgi:hypothetical protein